MAAAIEHSVFLAVVGGDMCTTTFTATMLRLQTAVAKIPRIAVAIDFFTCVEDAVKSFMSRPEFKTLAIAHSFMGTPVEFFMNPIPTGYDVVISPYPLPVVDWNRVGRVFAESSPLHETDKFVGNVYSVDTAGISETARDKRYAEIARGRVRQAAVYKIRRDAVAAVVRESPGQDPFPPDPEARVLMDTWCQSINHGSLAYAGCVGNRVSVDS